MNTFKEAVKELVREAFRANNAEDEKEKDEKVENEDVDKRKLIDEVAGIMKSAGCDDEVIKTAIAKMEKIGYDKSEDGEADNCGKKAKNEDEEEKDEKFEEEKEIAENKKAKNEDKEEEDEEDEDKEEKAENKCKNSMDDVKKAVFGGKSQAKTYVSRADRIELGNNY